MPPLALTPFERMMVADDSPAYPMVAIVELSFTGTLRSDALDDALSLALDRHPLLRSRIDRTIWGGLRWVPTGQPCVDYRPEARPDVGKHIDLTRTAGLRVTVCPNETGSNLTLEVHHACCDGVGIFRFVEDVLVGYANHFSAPTNALRLRPLDTARLKRRNRFGWNSKSLRQWLYHLYFGSSIVLRFSANPPKPLGLPRTSEKSCGECVRVAQQCKPTLLAQLRTAAARQDVTLNDLLARDLFLAIRSWNAACGDTDQEAVRRILVPCDLRSSDDVSTAAANIMSYSFLNRRHVDCERTDELLRGIQSEMEYIRGEKASLYFIRTLEMICCIPGAMSWNARTERCFATCLLSNIGDPTRQFYVTFPREKGQVRVGDVALQSIVSYPPLRPQTRAGMIIATYANQLRIGYRFDAKHFSEHDGQRFADIYLQCLERSARRV